MGNSVSSVHEEQPANTLTREELEIQTNGFLRLPKTHDVSFVEEHVPNVETFASDLRRAVDAVWSTRNEGRYAQVHVLLLSWEDDSLGVRKESQELRTVFTTFYNFEVEDYEIPSDMPGQSINRRILDFLRHSTPSNLFIVYYAGHARPSHQTTEPPIWAATDQGSSATLPSGGIQYLFEEAASDVLLLYDCCHSAHPAVSISGHGVTEVISACGFETQTPAVGPNSFTKTLIEELARSYQGSPFSVATLHSRVLGSLKNWKGDLLKDNQGGIWRDQDGRVREECYKRRTPIHCFLSNEIRYRSIFLAPLVPKPPALGAASTASVDSSTTDLTSGSKQATMSTSRSSINESTISKFPQVLLSIRLDEHYLSSDVSQQRISEWTEWLRNMPGGAKDIKIQGAYESFSTLLILSMPISVWDALPNNLAYSFIGFITSENKAPFFKRPPPSLPVTDPNIQSESTPQTDNVRSSTPIFSKSPGGSEPIQIRSSDQHLDPQLDEMKNDSRLVDDIQWDGSPRTIRQHSAGNLEGPHAGQPIRPSVANVNIYRDEGNSSSSPTSSITSNMQGRVATVKIERTDELEGLIKDEAFRSDPEVAELVYSKVKGRLEYATPNDIEQPVGSHELSLLRLLEPEAFGLVQPNGGSTAFAGSSASGTSAPDGNPNCGPDAGASSSSANLGNSGALIPKKDLVSPNEGPTQQIKLQKNSSKPGASKARGFRCFHNALYPATFCVNEETHQKFRTCTGPGWKNMQHLKDHLRDIHMKQVKKPNMLQCSTCLTEFPNQDELASHAATVDCLARCLECEKEFGSKALRLAHQQNKHFAEASEGLLLELDEKKWKKIKEDLKGFNTYSDWLKKGTCEPKPEIETWIDANVALYEYHRSDKAKARARIELGQWYVIYTALAPHMKIVDHPFYDNTPILHDEMAEEKILLTNDIIVESRIEAHGPPSDPDLQREWYRDALRDALKIAGRTTRNVTYTHDSPSSTIMNTSLSAQGSSTNPPMGPTPGVENFGSNMSISESPNVHDGYSEIMPPQQDYLSGARSQATMNTESDLMGMQVGMDH